MTVYWFVKYMKDEDGVQVNLNPSEKLTTRQRPLLSLWFQDPFIKSKLHRYDKTLTGKKYNMILRGKVLTMELRRYILTMLPST